uniref:hypothetical protein n=1 Tax=Ornithobacterium rhinotracheale TaxID=28251 RepID=UPI00129C905B|nr:hypothetical protein [Ornithobacterium rhinotracheale]
MIKIEIKIVPSAQVGFYNMIERKSLWGWTLSKKITPIEVQSSAFEDVRLRQCHLQSLLLLWASKKYFLPHSLHLNASV